jgi:hypothetical protein
MQVERDGLATCKVHEQWASFAIATAGDIAASATRAGIVEIRVQIVILVPREGLEPPSVCLEGGERSAL